MVEENELLGEFDAEDPHGRVQEVETRVWKLWELSKDARNDRRVLETITCLRGILDTVTDAYLLDDVDRLRFFLDMIEDCTYSLIGSHRVQMQKAEKHLREAEEAWSHGRDRQRSYDLTSTALHYLSRVKSDTLTIKSHALRDRINWWRRVLAESLIEPSEQRSTPP